MSQSRQSPRRAAVTMRDVAKHANVSQSTVSRILSGAKENVIISEETRQRVLDAVKALGYQPNLNAVSLRGQKSHMIGVMIADVGNPFYHPAVRAIQDVADRYQYDVMVSNSDYTPQGEHRFLNSAMRRPLDGIIMAVSHIGYAEVELLINRTGAEVGIIGQYVDHPRIDITFSDDERAMADAVTWLIEEKGHRRIGFIGVKNNRAAGARRARAYCNALARFGIERQPAYEVCGNWTPASGHEAMLQLLALPEPPTAVLACNDLMAIGAMTAARKRGFSIPDDVALIGFDDIPAASWLSPSLSTIAQSPYQMGLQLTEGLFERIQGNYRGPGRRFEVSCQFIEREST